MRKTVENQYLLGQVDISEIEFDLKSRDEIPKVLAGLQYIFVTKSIRERIFALLASKISPHVRKDIGRRGMSYWKILVLGVLRLSCKWDFDKLHNMSNNHKKIRMMLGHSSWPLDDWYYELQTIKDNVSLLSEDLLIEISQIVIESGHKLLGKKKDNLFCSMDSFPVETNVHFPTDINLLYDSIRTAIRLTSRFTSDHGWSDWRQWLYNTKCIKDNYRKIVKLIKSRIINKEAKLLQSYASYIELVSSFISRINETLSKIEKELSIGYVEESQLNQIRRNLSSAEKQIDLINRRKLQGEKIPHSEKIFSIFQPHTRWIRKGKLGVLVELGLPVCIIKDQFGFVLSHEVMEVESDVEVAVPLTRRAKAQYPTIQSCSYDAGFWSPSNYKALCLILSKVYIRKKGRPQKRTVEEKEEYKKMMRKHSAVESSINGLEQTGLDKCRDHGILGFRKYVAMGILARNLFTLGNIILMKAVKKQKRKAAA